MNTRVIRILINDCFQNMMESTNPFLSQITPEKDKMLLASFHLTGRALTWFMCLEKDESTQSWPNFLSIINKHSDL